MSTASGYMVSMTSRPTISCRKCGAPFTASRAGTTVNCPACRATGTKVAAKVAATRIVTCFCGKTVISSGGVATGNVCPRGCHV